MHTGDSPKKGHYTACCYTPSTSRWYLFNDHLVKEVTVEEVTSTEAYCLLYRRASLRWDQKLIEEAERVGESLNPEVILQRE
jgi:hypothetical protein